MTVSVASDAADPRINGVDFLDGSNAEKFDPLMRGFPENTVINLLEGVFETTGSLSYNEQKGWFVKDGWKVRGGGIYHEATGRGTKVIHAAWPGDTQGNGHGVFQMSIYDRGGVEISDLTVDQNWPNLGAPQANVTFAVSLIGDNNIIRRVKAINGYGNAAALRESFELTIGARFNQAAGKWENNVGGLIEECEVADYRGDYGMAIGFIGGSDGYTGSMQGIIRNNTVNNFKGTAPFGAGNVILEGNRARGCRGFFYTDTGAAENIVIRNNEILDTSYPAIYFANSMGAATVRNVLIEGNTIEPNGEMDYGAGVVFWSPLGTGRQLDVAIRGNTFRKKDSGPYTILAIAAGFVDGLVIENNIVDPGMRSVLGGNNGEAPNSRVLVRNNRTPSGEIPIGLEDTTLEPKLPMEQQLDQIAALVATLDALVKHQKQQIADAQAVKPRLDKIQADLNAILTG